MYIQRADPIELSGADYVILATPFFRIYQHTDPIGVEVCGALKNVLAIASGISDASLLGSNSRAALLTRGLSEMTIAVQTFGRKASVQQRDE